jgi:outer membrane biosynthesis protein TonB
MLRMMLLGLLIPLGVGVLAAMELRTPPRTLATVVQPLAETTVGISDSHAALAKADRLEITYATTGTPTQPTQPDPVDERISPSEAITVGSPEAPRIINRHRHDPKAKKVATAALPKSKPKTTDIKRTAIPDRVKAAGNAEPCRLSEFGGLRKALNLSGCEI